MSNVAQEMLIGRTLAGKYLIERSIGTGGMGSVYRARQIALDKWVAVKVLHRDLAGDPKFVARFEREALSASRLDHPNSLRVLDFGEDAGLLYIVMEYVDADDLLTLMNREWPWDDARSVRILSQVLAALAIAHDLGIVHRDLKPENILVVRGEDDDGVPGDQVKVCDFGVAKMAPREGSAKGAFARRLTVDGLAIGTPDYMSPEQARGEPVDGRSDVYSLGVVLYYLLAGRMPFVGESALGVALQHVSDQPVPPSRHRQVHPILESICLRALAKRPEDRFQNAREMRRALRAALDGSATVTALAPPLAAHPPAVTPCLGSVSVTLLPPDLKLLARRKRPSRLRRTVGAVVATTLLALALARSFPTVRQTVEAFVPALPAMPSLSSEPSFRSASAATIAEPIRTTIPEASVNAPTSAAVVSTKSDVPGESSSADAP